MILLPALERSGRRSLPLAPAIQLLVLVFVVVCCSTSPTAADTFFRRTQFVRGDANTDGKVDVSDGVFTLNFLFSPNSPEPACDEAANTNDDPQIDVSDPVFTFGYLFSGSLTPPDPGPTECGVDPGAATLGCDAYDLCPDDTDLVFHALSRITAGANEDLLTDIQTKDDLIDYINSQLDDVPADYDPAVDEPSLASRVEALGIGFQEWDTLNNPHQRLKGMLIENSLNSEWQLLHVVTQFWNNHFHSQTESLREQFFGRSQRGGQANRGNQAIFDVVDADVSGAIDEAEWEGYRATRRSLKPFAQFGRALADDATPNLVSFSEFDNTVIAYWKYGRGRDQRAVAADMERREYDFYRRHAFGGFGDLFEGCAKSVAMLIYLTNFQNIASNPNENYAREYLELQGFGVDILYTQKDIEELARVFTGWTVGWVQRSLFDPLDLNFQDHPEAQAFAVNGRLPVAAPFNFPSAQNWSDDVYTWAFVFGRTQDHDWDEKALFDQEYGGVDSLGNPLDGSVKLTIPANANDRTVDRAMEEFDMVLDRTIHQRDCAKFISTKLIQLFVTDDLTELEKTLPLPDELQAGFDLADRDGNGVIELAEWEQSIPFVLPNGRPLEVFDRLDANGNEEIAPIEYQEPDLLGACIDTWLDADGAIGQVGNMREVVRTILLSDEFLSLDFYRAKIKTPYESALSAMRALNAVPTVGNVIAITNDLLLGGMELFDFGDPTGESELGFDWMHTVGLLERLKFVNRGANPVAGRDVRFLWDPVDFENRWQLNTDEDVIDFFALLFHGNDILDEQRELAIEARSSASAQRETSTPAAFLLSLPQFQKQ